MSAEFQVGGSDEVFQINGEIIPPGEQRIIHLPGSRLFDSTSISIPVEVVRGQENGPVLFLSAAIHGDEINGVEIIHRVMSRRIIKFMRGTLIAVPIVNVYGFNTGSRYLPDRRDLNRSFPGSQRGSPAGQLAHLFMKEIVSKATHGLDLHTGAIHRTNLPQIRACLDDPETRRLAESFGTPVIINSSTRDGSLREAARERNIPVLLYEAGEALRFDEWAIRTGVRGILNVMRGIGMLPARRGPGRKRPPVFEALDSHWIRAPRSGILRTKKQLGLRVTRGEILGTVSDPLGYGPKPVRARETGIIIGMAQLPLVSRGDAVFHVATFRNPRRVARMVEEIIDHTPSGDSQNGG